MKRILVTIAAVVFNISAYSWNAMGHQLVAQIAYDNLTPKVKRECNKYNQALNKVYPIGSFVRAATWLDTFRPREVHWFDTMHYIDIPFSNDNTPLPVSSDINAQWAINQAIAVLHSKKSNDADKGLSLRILIHTVGDIHQPLHTATLVTQNLPKGDLGGNLFPLGANPIATNLHMYWDNGGGVLVGQSTDFQVRNKAHQLESRWPCASINAKSNVQDWVDAGHDIAVSQVYSINPGSVPDKRYQLNAQNISQKQILLAGCRLANVLNKNI
jgi:hypothetical protein